MYFETKFGESFCKAKAVGKGVWVSHNNKQSGRNVRDWATFSQKVAYFVFIRGECTYSAEQRLELVREAQTLETKVASSRSSRSDKTRVRVYSRDEAYIVHRQLFAKCGHVCCV